MGNVNITSSNITLKGLGGGVFGSKSAVPVLQLLGIPTPDFAIDETRPTRPVDWSSEVAGYYYVSESTGTDSGRTYGTPAAPRSTIPSLGAGSYVEVAGEYTLAPQGAIILSGAGTSAAWVANTAGPVWITTSPTDQGIFRREGACVVSGTYVYFDGVNAECNLSPRSNGLEVNHIAFLNVDFSTMNATPLTLSSFGGLITEPINNIVYSGCTFHDNDPDWDTVSGGDTDAHGIKPDEYCNNVWIINNTFQRIGGNACQISDQNSVQGNCHSIYVAGNDMGQTRQSVIGIKKAKDVFIMWNTLHDSSEVQTGNPPAGITYQYAPENIWIGFNHIYNCERGIASGSDTSPAEDNIYIIGNLIEDCVYSGTITNPDSPWHFGQGMSIVGSPNVRIIGNTVRGCNGGVSIAGSNKIANIENNIIADMIGGHDHIFVESGTSASASTLKNNLLDDAGVVVRWGTTNTASRQSITAVDASNVGSNPLFISVSDSRLQVGSPAKTSGLIATELTEDIYGLYTTLYSRDIDFDLDEVQLASVGSVTIGAYQ